MIVDVKVRLSSIHLDKGHRFEDYVVRSLNNNSEVTILSSDHTVVAAPKSPEEVRNVLAELKKPHLALETNAAATYAARISALEWVLGLREDL